MKFSGTVLFLTLWFLVVYAPLAHMVWGKGGLLNGLSEENSRRWILRAVRLCTFLRAFPRGVCAVSRQAYRISKAADAAAQPGAEFHRGLLAVVGWFGFNAGSALASNSLATSAFVATHFAAAAAALSWSAAEWIKNGRASALGAISGAVAGLVAITPAAGFVGPMPALAIGLIAGVVCYWMVTKVKAIFGMMTRWMPSACTAQGARSARCSPAYSLNK